MGKYEFLFWDADQTLLDFLQSEEYALKLTFSKFGMEIDQAVIALYSGINDAYWKRLEKGEVSLEEVRYGRFETLFEKLQIQRIPITEFLELYQHALGSVYFINEDSLQLLTKLKEEGYRQYIVTNGVTWTQQNKLHLAGFDRIVENIFISEQLGHFKPCREFFDACFLQIEGFDKSRALLIGDSLSSDMQGGNNAGIDCCWYNREHRSNDRGVKIDYEISHLAEIRKILE